ncbi:hypothetical protein GL218_08203 [Daldinia childiae]|uniref:uncharacterized protein n=1 Tax=Daldinia childiae TaxID=326645 RepID=UPI0014484602|nr:uncharacterized protein GL218_08203 [Daldinia childiae]KAF3068985.1 hypothetical protein GL218_08203 [Daldinia childiae]
MRGRIALCLSLAGQALAAPAHVRRAECTELSTTTPNWKLSNAASSDWPGGQSGRVELFARHVPTNTLADCDVEYRLNADGEVIDYDPTSTHECLNFGPSPLNTTVQLNMETLVLSIQSSWTCEGDEKTYSASGEVTLNRDASPGACLVEPSQVGESTTCPIADVEVEGKLAEA